ncbi:MAG TPA: hypothetical protein VE110_05375 [Gemmatimonadaceae bacterium]|nr:hypothetical protein [Gemmatimonadaceae bacterium]
MEESSVTVFQTLERLVLPIGLLGILIGIFAAAAGVRMAILSNAVGAKRDETRTASATPTATIESIAVWVCAPISLLGIVVAVQTIRFSSTSIPRFPPVAVLAGAALILTGLPAILWKTRFRWAAEGVALAALGGSAILSAWSIGAFLLPVLALMLWVCLEHLGVYVRTEFARHRRVDSLL